MYGFFVLKAYLLLKIILMKKIYKSNSQVRTEKEKLVMENFTSVMKRLDATFLIENDKEEEEEEEVEGDMFSDAEEIKKKGEEIKKKMNNLGFD